MDKIELNEVNKKIVDAVVAKAQECCPHSLALVGVYGSVATGDCYKNSDLDLLILIQDDNGWSLGSGFILNDSKIGYDIYCTKRDSLLWESQCHHAQLAKLLDSKIIYVKDQEAYEELLKLRESALAFLKSDERFGRVRELLDKAKVHYADSLLQDDLGKVRLSASGAVRELLNAVMIFNGTYFKRGVKRIFNELSQFNLDESFIANLKAVAVAKDAEAIRILLKELVLFVESYVSQKKNLELPSAGNISGTLEEMYSNWRNKVDEAAANKDSFSSFMNMCSLAEMVQEIGDEVDIGSFEIMSQYDPENLEANTFLYDKVLEDYSKVYRSAGMDVRRFSNVDEFVKSYLQKK